VQLPASAAFVSDAGQRTRVCGVSGPNPAIAGVIGTPRRAAIHSTHTLAVLVLLATV
jgi:hypothetical protein